MGRYSTVQAYTDNNRNMRSVPYEQATGSTELKKGPVKTEKIVNPYGSVAGANSGDFHMYRHARAREMERMAGLEQSDRERELDEQYQALLAKNAQEAANRTAKRRKKRERSKTAKLRKSCLAQVGVQLTGVAEEGESGDDEEYTYEAAQPQVGLEVKRQAAGESSSLKNDEFSGEDKIKLRANVDDEDDVHKPAKKRATTERPIS